VVAGVYEQALDRASAYEALRGAASAKATSGNTHNTTHRQHPRWSAGC